MNDTINISFAELTAKAQNIKKTSAEVEAILSQVKTTINNLDQSWKSQSSSDLIANFQNLEKVIKGHKETIDAYAKFLNDTVTTYSETESDISKIAQKFNI